MRRPRPACGPRYAAARATSARASPGERPPPAGRGAAARRWRLRRTGSRRGSSRPTVVRAGPTIAPMDATGLHALDIALRGGLAVLLAFVAAVLLRDRGRAVGARLGAAFAGGVALHLVLGMPGVNTPPAAWQAPLFAIRAGNAVVLWALAGALFDDDFRLRGRHVAAWLAMAALGGSACAVGAGLGPPWPVRFGMVIDAAAAGFALLAAA